MKKQFLFTVAAAVLSALCLTGCQDTVNTMENRDLSMNPDSVDTRKFSTDSFCRDRLTLLSMRRSTIPGGVMMVQAAIRSERHGFWSELWSGFRGDNPYHVLYRFDWLDEHGIAVHTYKTDIFVIEIVYVYRHGKKRHHRGTKMHQAYRAVLV